jgi:VCBS repeat-containing protein
MATIQGVYVALFGRPADPGGLAYWEAQTGGGTDLSAMIGALTGTEEFILRFAGLSDAAIIESIYLALFGRAAEPAGLEYFLRELAAGRQTIETIAINILDGAQGGDLATLAAKLDAADLFTARLDLESEVDAYKGADAAQVGVEFLANVDADTPVGEDTTDEAIRLLFEEEPGGGGSGGGSPGGGPDPDEDDLQVLVFDNPIYVDSDEDGFGEESTNVQASLAAGGVSVSTVVDITAEALEAALEGKDVLLFPEQETSSAAPTLLDDLSDEAKQVIKDFVDNGGRLIIHGDEPTEQSGVAIVNEIFELTLTEAFGVGASTKTNAASGSFADDPGTLPGNTAMSGIGIETLPEASIVMYETDIGEYATVATIKQGEGEIVYLGWDWENAAPIGVQDGGWLEVLDSAVRYEFNRVPVIAAPIELTFTEDEIGVMVDLLAGASDPDGDDLDIAGFVQSVDFPNDGRNSYIFSTDRDDETGELTITSSNGAPNGHQLLAAGQEIVTILTYDIVDGNGGITEQTATITVTGANDAPVIDADQSFASDGQPGVIGTIAASDIDDDDIVFSVIEGAPAGITVGEDGQITLGSELEYGTYQVTIGAYDGVIQSEETVEIIVAETPTADFVVDDSFTATNAAAGEFKTIQEAVDAADDRNAPTMIQINAGTYVEQVVIDGIDDLELRGVGRDQVIIRAPEDVVKTAAATYEANASSDDVFAVVQAVDALNVTISGVTVDGDDNGAAANAGAGTDAPYYTGIGYVRASGAVDDVSVTGIGDDDPNSNAWQSGVLVFNGYENTVISEGELDGLLSFSLTNSAIEDTGYYGVAAYRADVTIENNVIAAGNPDNDFGFFGMELYEVTGRVEGNTVMNLAGADYGNFRRAEQRSCAWSQPNLCCWQGNARAR